MSEVNKEQVLEALGWGAAPAPAENPEDVPSADVKPAETPVKQEETPAPEVPADKAVDVTKLSTQIENLNKALSEERELRKTKEKEVEETKTILDRMKWIFVPNEEPVTPKEPQYMTPEQVEEFIAKREEEKNAIAAQESYKANLRQQVEKLTSEWNGENWKPKYEDEEVFAWQVKNKKEHLEPEEAFKLMKADDIADWKAKEILSRKPNPTNQEQPSWVSSEHQPQPQTPKTAEELKAAIMEALSSQEM